MMSYRKRDSKERALLYNTLLYVSFLKEDLGRGVRETDNTNPTVGRSSLLL